MATLQKENTRTDYSFPQNGSTVDRAMWWYDHELRSKLEKRVHVGKHLIINPDTGEWVMGDDPDGEDDLEVSHRAISQFGTARLFGLRIGYTASEALGATLEPLKHLAGDEEGVARG